jgi:hypothetical protein
MNYWELAKLYARRFAHDRRGDPGKTGSFFNVLILDAIALALLPVIITFTQINTSTWNFTGHAAAATLVGLVPLFYILLIVVANYFYIQSMGHGGKA